jgi:hypothetical protein
MSELPMTEMSLCDCEIVYLKVLTRKKFKK